MIYKNSTLYLIVTLLAVSALILGLIIGCDEKQIKSPVVGSAAGSGPVGGGDAQKIRLTANPSSTITAVEEEQATVKISAIVENNIGQPMPDGTVVYWTATVGTLDSVTTTTSNGASTVTLTFPEAFTGSSVVTATSGDATGSITVKVVNVTPTPTITATSTPTTGFVVSAAQTTIAHQGTTTITAYVTENGEPESGVQVSFSVSGAGILQESAAITDAAGKATVILIGNNTSGNDQTATVTATAAGGRTGTVSVIVTGGATPTPTSTPTASTGFVVSAAQTTIAHQGTTTITAYVTQDGEPEPNVQVNFSVSGAGILQESAAVTDATGRATVILIGNNTSGSDQTATVTATATGGRTGTVSVVVTGGATPTPTPTTTPSLGFVVSADDPTITHQGTTEITAYASRNGQPEEGIQVNFSVSGAGALQQSAAITDDAGNATVTLIGKNTSTTTDQTATVTATTSDGRSGSVSVIVEHQSP